MYKQKISIITVCKNSDQTLEKTIQSVIEQSWTNVEHIVIDGGSLDNTLNIIEKYRSNLSYVFSGQDKGIYDAMNKGIKVATGDIICFLNADDFYNSSNILSQVVNQMQQYNLDILMGDVSFFNKKNPHRVVRYYTSQYFTQAKLSYGWMPAHPALFITRKVSDSVGFFKDDYKIAGDFEYIIRIFKNNKIRYGYLPRPLVNMQIGGVSTRGFYSILRINQEILRACRENNIKTNIFKILLRYPYKTLEYFIKSNLM